MQSRETKRANLPRGEINGEDGLLAIDVLLRANGLRDVCGAFPGSVCPRETEKTATEEQRVRRGQTGDGLLLIVELDARAAHLDEEGKVKQILDGLAKRERVEEQSVEVAAVRLVFSAVRTQRLVNLLDARHRLFSDLIRFVLALFAARTATHSASSRVFGAVFLRVRVFFFFSRACLRVLTSRGRVSSVLTRFVRSCTVFGFSGASISPYIASIPGAQRVLLTSMRDKPVQSRLSDSICVCEPCVPSAASSVALLCLTNTGSLRRKSETL